MPDEAYPHSGEINDEFSVMREGLRAKMVQLESKDTLYRYTPPSLAEFITSPEYLEYPALSPVQFHDSLQVLGPDPKKIFSDGSPFRIGVFLWGKGGGKDWTCSLLTNFILQVLLCMENPHAFFGMPEKSYIDILNVSLSEEHAITIYWEYFKTALKSNKWILQRYSLYEGNKLLAIEGNEPGKPKIKLSAGVAEFEYPRIRARAYGADNESAEGGNPVVWLMDEADAFKSHTKIANAKKIYSTLRTSSATRFGTKWKGFIISYPRSEDGFAVSMYNESQKKSRTDEGDTIYGSRHATWEVLPDAKFSKKTFEFMGMNIPMDFFDDFTRYPEESLAKIACIPPKVESAFFSFRERILQSVVPDKTPMFRTENTLIEHEVEGGEKRRDYIGKVITWIKEKSWATLHTPRVIAVDGGLTNNRAALIMAHGEPIEIVVVNEKGEKEKTYVNKVLVDAIVVWQPDKRKGLQVSLNNIESLIIELKTVHKFNIVRVSYDQWNSQTSIETLQSLGIRAEEHTVENKDYFELRSMVYNGGVELLPSSYHDGDTVVFNDEAELLLSELQRLQLLNGKKIDHPLESEGGSKDVADCLASVNRLLNQVGEKKKIVAGFPKGILGPGFSRASASPFSPAAQGVMGDLAAIPGMPKSPTPIGGLAPNQPLHTKQLDRPNPESTRPSSFPRSVLSGGNGGGMMPNPAGQSPLPSHLR